MIRVLVVDDSLFMRKALCKMLDGDPDIRVVGQARDGIECLAKIQELDPDLVTLDVEMPRMGGVETLSRIMAEWPRPVLMVSSATSDGAEDTLRALELGALDFVQKHIGGSVLDIVHIEQVLRAKVKALAGRKHGKVKGVPTRAQPPSARAEARGRTLADGGVRYIAVGASTGGPPALQKLFSGFSPHFPASVVLVQHMPKAFTGPFAKRLSQAGPLEVKEAETGDHLEAGRGFVAPGGSHLVVRREGAGLVLQVTDRPLDTLHRPSVDVLFQSFAEAAARETLGVVLTGMGVDGLEGAKALKARGGSVIAQSAESCVVYGMPRAVVDAGLADRVLPMEQIAAAVEAALQP